MTVAYYESRQPIEDQHSISMGLKDFASIEQYAQESLADGKNFGQARTRYEKSLHNTWKATRKVIGGIQVIDRRGDDRRRDDRPREKRRGDDRRRDEEMRRTRR